MAKKSFPAKKIIFPALALSIILNLYFLVYKYLPPFDSTEENHFISGQVTRIIDGDTFDLDDNQRIRLAGADAPEYPEACLSQQAKDRLEKLILGKEIKLELISSDSSGRQIAYAFLEDVLIDKILVEEGLGQAISNNPKYDPQILSLQNQAKKNERGIWSSQCQSLQPDETCIIKGNQSEDYDTKIYHLPECYNYHKIVIDENEGDQWFCTEAEARAAGFTKSQDCP